jgi:hypothetical protein
MVNRTSYLTLTIVIILIIGIVTFFYAMAHTSTTGSLYELKQYLTTLEQEAMGRQATTTSTMMSTTTTSTDSVSRKETPSPIHPYLYALTPSTGSPDLTIIITGYGFDHAVNYITFGQFDGRHNVDGLADNIIATEGSTDGKTLTFNVPLNAPSGLLCDPSGTECSNVPATVLSDGEYPVTVTSKGGVSNTLWFNLVH